MATDRSDRLMTGMFRDRESAERAYECVTSRGYTDKDVSLLMSDDTRTRCFPRDAVDEDGARHEGGRRAQGSGAWRAPASAHSSSGSPRRASPFRACPSSRWDRSPRRWRAGEPEEWWAR